MAEQDLTVDIVEILSEWKWQKVEDMGEENQFCKPTDWNKDFLEDVDFNEFLE